MTKAAFHVLSSSLGRGVEPTPLATRLTLALTLLMAAQALLGRLNPSAYRDEELIASTWIGNDWLTLLLAVPLILLGLHGARRGSAPAALVWLGGLGYAIYNYGFYLFGAVLNAFFPLYCLLLVLGVAALVLALAGLDARRLAAGFSPRTPVRLIGGAMTAIAAGLATVWLVMWARVVFLGQPAPGGADAFQVVAAMDLAIMVPALATGGLLLWRRSPWGFVLAPMACVLAALYLWLLALNSAVAISLVLVTPPAELPIWIPLALTMTVLAITLARCSGPPLPR